MKEYKNRQPMKPAQGTPKPSGGMGTGGVIGRKAGEYTTMPVDKIKPPRTQTGLSVKDQRKKAKEAGMSMKDWKAKTAAQGGLPFKPMWEQAVEPTPEPDKYQAYNDSLRGIYEGLNDNSGIKQKGFDPNLQGFDEDGYMRYNSEVPMYQNEKMLKEMGYKAGDMLWKPGTRDELNGRILTGEIDYFTASGKAIPKYENSSANSAFQGSGSSQTYRNLRDGSWHQQTNGSSGGGMARTMDFKDGNGETGDRDWETQS